MLTDLMKRRPTSEKSHGAAVRQSLGFQLGFSESDRPPENVAAMTLREDHGEIELGEYGRLRGLSTDEVWDRIESGGVVCTSRGGRLYVAGQLDRGVRGGDEPRPSVPGDAPAHEAKASKSEPDPSPQPMTEMALFIDHLSLAKEENKDILRLTQDSINRITQLSESVISLKDELLKARDTEIQALKKRLQSKNLTIRRLRQELEDLSMLASLPPVQSDAPKAR